MTVTIEQEQFMPIRITLGDTLIYIEQGEQNKMLVLERQFAEQFAQAIEAQRATTTEIGVVEDESAVRDSECARKDIG
jgi:hypothetical protein